MKRFLSFLFVFLFLISSAFAAVDDAEVYYSFDNADNTGSNPDDLSGNGRDGTNTNSAVTGETGILGESYNFSTGSLQYINTGYDPSVQDDYTYSFWLKTTSTSSNIHMLSNRFSGDYQSQIRMYNTAPGDIRYQEERNNNNHDFTTSGTYNDGDWHHFCISSERNGAYFMMIDGANVTSGTNSNQPYTFETILVGARNNEGTAETSFTGNLDEFAFYLTAKSSEDCLTLYNSGTGYNPYASTPPLSDDTLTITAQDADNSTSISVFNASVFTDGIIPYGYGNISRAVSNISGFTNIEDGAYFDGSSAYIASPINLTGSIYSFSMWLYVANENQNRHILSQYSDTSNRKFLFYQDGNNLRFYTDNNVYINSNNYFASTENKWVYITGIYNGTHASLYKNNSLVVSPTIKSLGSSNKYVFLGTNDIFGAGYWEGTLSQIRIYDRALNSSDITDLYVNVNNNSQTDYIASYFTEEYFDAGQTFSTTNGTLPINISTIAGGNASLLQNVTVRSLNYFPQNYTSLNISQSLLANLTHYPFVHVKNVWDNSTVSGNITINNILYELSNGKIAVPYNSTQTVYTNISNYFNVSASHNFASGNLTLYPYESIINFNVTEAVTNNALTGRLLIDGYNLSSTSFFNISTGTHNITFEKSGYFSKQFQIAIDSLDNRTINLPNVGDARLKINATNAQTGLPETTFNISLYGNNSFYSYGGTTNGSVYFLVKKDLNYTLYVNDSAHGVSNSTFLVNDMYENVTITMSTTNSMLITIYDEVTGLIINNTNMTIQFIGDYESRNVTITNGSAFEDLFTPSGYELRYFSTNNDNYKLRSYFFTLTPQSFNIIDLYALNDNSSTFTKATITFSVLDLNLQPVENAKIVVERYYIDENGFIQVYSRLTDVNGQATGTFESVDAFYKYKVYYDDVLRYSSSNSGTQFVEDDTLTIYIDTTSSDLQSIQSIEDMANSGTLTATKTGNLTGYFTADYENPNAYLICLEVFGTNNYNLSCTSSTSFTLIDSVQKNSINGTEVFTAIVKGYNTQTGNYDVIDSLTMTFIGTSYLQTNDNLRILFTLVFSVVLIAVAFMSIYNPTIAIIVQTTLFLLLAFFGTPIISIGWLSAGWIISILITGIFIIQRGDGG